MKTKSIIAFIIAIFIVALSTNVFAATGTVEFKANTTEVEKGNEFTVTLSANSEEGINGIDAKYNYDLDKLELVSESLADTTNWSNMGTASNITILCNSTDSIKAADLYIIKFKVKDNVSAGDKIKIEITDIILDTDAQTNSEVTIGTKKIELAVKSEISEKPSEESPEKPSEESPEKSSEESSEKSSEESSEKSSEEHSQKNTSNTTNTNKQDKTESTRNLPKTGKKVKTVMAIIVLIIISIFFLKKYLNNKDIK